MGRRTLRGAASLLLLAALAAPSQGAERLAPRVCSLPEVARAPISSATLSALDLLCAGGLRQNEPEGSGEPVRAQTRAGSAQAPPNARVNDPTPDPSFANGTHITQSEVSVAFSGSAAVMGYNDTTHLSDGGTLSLTGFAHSPDGGSTWQDRGEMPSAGGNTVVLGDPVLASRPDGTLFAVNLFWTGTQATDQHLIGVSTSTDGGLTFGAPSEAVSSIPPGELADKPWIAVDDTPTSPRAGTVYAAWAHFTAAGDSVIEMSRSTDGFSWSAASIISDPTCAPVSGSPHSSQGIQLDVAPGGDVYASWWCLGDSSFQIRFDRSTNGGMTWGTDRVVTTFLDPSGDAVVNCGTASDPSPTIVYEGNIRFNDFPSMAVNPTNGTIHLVWSLDPDGLGVDDAAVYHARSTDGGTTWSAPVVLGSHDSDQFFPMVRVASDGTVAAAWYDRRNDPNNLLIDMYLTSSTDDGATFGALERITTTSFGVPQILPNYDTTVRNCYMGDYNGMAATPANSFLLGWGDNRDPGPAANNGVDQNIYSAIFTPPQPPGPGPGPTPAGGCDIRGTTGKDRLTGTSAGETICGLGGSDTLNGRGGNDVLKGGGGSDLLRGGAGRDRLLGGPGKDRCLGARDVERSC